MRRNFPQIHTLSSTYQLCVLYLLQQNRKLNLGTFRSRLLRHQSPIMSRQTPILDCRDHASIQIHPTTATPSDPSPHPLQKPQITIPPHILPHIQTATSHILASRTIAFPTETVYGLGASSLDSEATSMIYKIKSRPSDNPLIIHVSSLDMLSRLLPPPSQYKLSKLYISLSTSFWPGPLTLLFPNPSPPPYPAPQTQAIRLPSHPLALAIIHHSDTPISAPSANSSGRPSPTKAIHVYNDLNGKEGLGCILDGGGLRCWSRKYCY